MRGTCTAAHLHVVVVRCGAFKIVRRYFCTSQAFRLREWANTNERIITTTVNTR